MGEGGLLTLFKIRQNCKKNLETNTLAYFKRYIINKNMNMVCFNKIMLMYFLLFKQLGIKLECFFPASI
jgi:hypothetical protein